MTTNQVATAANSFKDTHPFPGSHEKGSSNDPAPHEQFTAGQARLSVVLPRSLYKKVKLVAHDQDMTLSAWLIKLIRAELG